MSIYIISITFSIILCFKYTSKDTQNDIIKAAASCLLSVIVQEIKDAEYFAVIADETRDVSHVEQLSLCIRYIHSKDLVVKERFLKFADVHELHAEALVSTIVELGLDLNKCVAQCYNGASVMGGRVSGVQRWLQDIVGKGCIYIHCYAHRLNLVLVNVAHGIAEVSNFFGIMEAIYKFFSMSVLRHDALVKSQRDQGLRPIEIPRLSDTRWSCRYVAVKLYQTRYNCVLDALQMVISDRKDRVAAAEAAGHLGHIKQFSFILMLEILQTLCQLQSHYQMLCRQRN